MNVGPRVHSHTIDIATKKQATPKYQSGVLIQHAIFLACIATYRLPKNATNKHMKFIGRTNDCIEKKNIDIDPVISFMIAPFLTCLIYRVLL